MEMLFLIMFLCLQVRQYHPTRLEHQGPQPLLEHLEELTLKLLW